MTKHSAPVFAPSQERLFPTYASHAIRGLWVTSALVLAACSSTPLPPWPQASSSSSGPTSAAPAPADRAAALPAPNITPVAPNARLEALPYSAAIAELFPDPSERYSTPGLSDGRRSFTTNAELAELIQEVAKSGSTNNQRVGAIHAGSAQSGAPLWALIATKAATITPLALDETARPTVLIVAGQQGNAPASTEALLTMAKELGDGGLLAPLLERINIIMVPRANPDGFDRGAAFTNDGTDLRFDHLQLQTPEARFLAKLARDYRAAVVIDAGEFSAIEPTLQRFDAVRANDMGLQYAVTPNAHEFISKATREWLHEPMGNTLSQAGLRVDWIAHPVGQDASAGFAMETLNPTTLRNASILKHAASIEIQSRGSDIGRTHIQRRVHSHVIAVSAALQSIAKRADNLRKVQTFVARDVASQACIKTLSVQALQRQEQRELALIDRQSAQIIKKPVAWASSLSLSQSRTRPQACGYWLSANAVQATERLSMLGVNVQRVAELSSLQAEHFETTTPSTSGAAPSGSSVSLVRSTVEAAPGSYYISMNQPLAYIAAAALEPDTPYSYHSMGLFNSMSEVARITALPNLVFEDE